MNENIDLEKILEGCPAGTKFYSPLFGEVKLKCIYGNGSHTIGIICEKMNRWFSFNRAGKYEMIEMRCSDSWGNYYFSDECLLFPSKDQRDWSKFERFWDKSKVDVPKVGKFDAWTFRPYDRVLVRDATSRCWKIDFYGVNINPYIGLIDCASGSKPYCIPYNEETEHLVGTSEDCPDYYKWWRE